MAWSSSNSQDFFGSREGPESSKSRQKYWRDKEWGTIFKSIEDARRFISLFAREKVTNYVKDINNSFEVEHLDSIILHNTPHFELDKFRLDDIPSRKSLPPGGLKVSIVYSDPELFAQIPKYLLPEYLIQNYSPVQIAGNSCRVCKCSLLLDKMHCSCCGIPICSLCACNKIILHTGFDKEVSACTNCSKQSDETNALLWINRTEFAMKSGENSSARLFLKIGHDYAINSHLEMSREITHALKNVENCTTELQDYKTKILSLKLQGLEGFQWGIEAQKMCKEGDFMFPYALFCIKLINVPHSAETDQQWEALGDRLGLFHEELALTCYNQCSSFGAGKWMEKAKLHDDQKSKEDWIHRKVSFLCLQKGLQTGNSRPRVTFHFLSKEGLVDELFLEDRHRLALYALKAASVPNDQVIELLIRWYNSVDSQTKMLVVISLMKYIIHTFDVEAIEQLEKDVPVLLMLIQIRKLSGLSTPELLDELNRIYRFNSYHIPLAFIRSSATAPWEDLSEMAFSMNYPHAGRVLKKMEEIGELMSDGAQSSASASRLDINVNSWIEEL